MTATHATSERDEGPPAARPKRAGRSGSPAGEICEPTRSDGCAPWADLRGQTAREATLVHSRILKCPLAVDEARVYWQRATSLVLPRVADWQREHAGAGNERDPCERLELESQLVSALATPTQLSTSLADQAFAEFWFGTKSLRWTSELLGNLHLRFSRYPHALEALHQVTKPAAARSAFDLATRTLICHWHLQLADPLYRTFTSDFLVARREHPSALSHGLRREMVVTWLGGAGKAEWTLATRKNLATKLVSAALSAGLVAKRRDPRELPLPTVPDDALVYLLYLLREVRFEGTLLDNPYLRSVGLDGRFLDDRLARLTPRGDLAVRRQGSVLEVDWHASDLCAWVTQRMTPDGSDHQ